VNCQVSDVSFHIIETLLKSPRSTSIPALVEGVAAELVFKTTTLSSTKSSVVLICVVVPETVKSPVTIRSLNVTLAVVATS